MNIFHVLISFEDIDGLFSENHIFTRDDRFRIQSFTFSTLIRHIGSDFTPFELDEVYQIESFNLKRMLRIAHIYFHDKEKRDKINSLPRMINYRILGMKEYPDIKLQESIYFMIFMKAALSNYDDSLEAKLTGKIPFKLFSLRQHNANEWFVNYCNFITKIASKIYYKTNPEEALWYLYSNLVYYINKSQTFKYFPKNNESVNDSIVRILDEFLVSDEQSEFKKLKDNIPFYKDL